MKKFIYLEIFFFILIIIFFLIPSFAKLPQFITGCGGCPSCDNICVYNVDYIDIFIGVPPNYSTNLCNVRTALKITKTGSPLNPYLNEIELITYRPSLNEHTLTSGYWERQIELDNSIPEAEAKQLTEKNIKFKIILCYTNVCVDPNLERIWEPNDYKGLKFHYVRVDPDRQSHLQIVVEIQEAWDTKDCKECCID